MIFFNEQVKSSFVNLQSGIKTLILVLLLCTSLRSNPTSANPPANPECIFYVGEIFGLDYINPSSAPIPQCGGGGGANCCSAKDIRNINEIFKFQRSHIQVQSNYMFLAYEAIGSMFHDYISQTYPSPSGIANIQARSQKVTEVQTSKNAATTTKSSLRNLRRRQLLLDDDDYGFFEMRSFYNPENDCRDARRVMNEYYTGSRIKAYNLTQLYGQLVYILNEPWRIFYCVLCSVKGIDSISYWLNALSIRLYDNWVYYHWDFCFYLLQNAMNSAYGIVHNYYYYFRAALKWIDCGPDKNTPGIKLNSTVVSLPQLYEIFDPVTSGFTVCYWFYQSFTSAQFLIELICESRCQAYWIQRSTNKWEGNVEEIKKLYFYLGENARPLKIRRVTVLGKNYRDINNYLNRHNLEIDQKKGIFFDGNHQINTFQDYKSDIILFWFFNIDGVWPDDYLKDTKFSFYMVYVSSAIIQKVLLFFTFALILF